MRRKCVLPKYLYDSRRGTNITSENTNKGGWHENKWIRGAIPAFLGNVVEKDIHKSSLIATICFAGGMAGTGFLFRHQRELIRQLPFRIILNRIR